MPPQSFSWQLPASLPHAIAQIRENVRIAAAQGVSWTAVLDNLRPHLTDWWAAFSLYDREQFLRHPRALWEIHRHRAPQDSLDVLESWRKQAGWHWQKGTIKAAGWTGNGVEVRWRDAVQTFDRIVLCTGNSPDPAQNPLLAQMITDGLLVADPLRLGIHTDADGRAHADGLWALGSLRRGTLWESTAVPELSRQCARLAELLRG